MAYNARYNGLRLFSREFCVEWSLVGVLIDQEFRIAIQTIDGALV